MYNGCTFTSAIFISLLFFRAACLSFASYVFLSFSCCSLIWYLLTTSIACSGLTILGPLLSYHKYIHTMISYQIWFHTQIQTHTALFFPSSYAYSWAALYVLLECYNIHCLLLCSCLPTTCGIKYMIQRETDYFIVHHSMAASRVISKPPLETARVFKHVSTL